MIEHMLQDVDRFRFKFGENWAHFLTILDEGRIQRAEESLRRMFAVSSLEGRSFLDIGSGSGLFSLAARRLGARVCSFDYDEQCVSCTQELKVRYFPSDEDWRIEKGSALDRKYVASLGKFDIVYSWGVLHHTGAMWRALENASLPIHEGGSLCVAIYNDQGRRSRCWAEIKRLYNRLPSPLRFLVLGPAFAAMWGPAALVDIMDGQPFRSWKGKPLARGMSPWRDTIDWVGGYPFEVATPDKIFHFYHSRGFSLEAMTTCGRGHGCNEYLFRKRL